MRDNSNQKERKPIGWILPWALLTFVWLFTSCGSWRPLPPSAPFPPGTAEELRLWVQYLAPIEIPASVSDILAARVQRSDSTHTNLWTYFFAFRCSAAGAETIVNKNNPYDNSVIVDPLHVTVTNDTAGGIDRPIISPKRFPEPPVFPDVFYEKHDLSKCNVLRIPVAQSPEWFTPQRMKRGIADRCIWRKGQVWVQFYYDADRQIMFIRCDELRPWP